MFGIEHAQSVAQIARLRQGDEGLAGDWVREAGNYISCRARVACSTATIARRDPFDCACCRGGVRSGGDGLMVSKLSNTASADLFGFRVASDIM
jgi:hypothetical protein